MNKIVLFVAIVFFFGCLPDAYDVEMVMVDGGSFIMGKEEETDEKPSHVVEVNGFYIGRYEVTQELWKLVMRGNPSWHKGDNLPVECVSWYDIQRFIARLNKKTGHSYRLPTEAEWEYAAKGGKKSRNYLFSGGDCESVAWFVENSGGETHEVGLLEPNELGLYDMCGNVHEWCFDTYNSFSCAGSVAEKQNGMDSEIKVYRGGSWYSSKRYCRPANRNKTFAGIRNFSIGFRLAEDINKE